MNERMMVSATASYIQLKSQYCWNITILQWQINPVWNIKAVVWLSHTNTTRFVVTGATKQTYRKEHCKRCAGNLKEL